MGHFKYSQKDGQGVYTGLHEIYIGEFKEDQFDGHATKILSDGTREVGFWNHSGTNSAGTITWKDGRRYDGDWKVAYGYPELAHGQGTITWPDGRQYVGHFHDGKMDGTGKMTYPDGRVEEGLWKEGKFMGASKSP